MLSFLLIIGCVFSIVQSVQAQTGQTSHKLIQLTGMVVHGDSLEGVPKARVSIAGSGRSTTTNGAGYFSLPILAGDSVLIEFQDQQQYLTISSSYPKKTYSAIIKLNNSIIPLAKMSRYNAFQKEFLELETAAPPTHKVKPQYEREFFEIVFKTGTKKN